MDESSSMPGGRTKAVPHVSICDGGLTAYLNIDPPENGGSGPVYEGMLAALASCEVTCHINLEKLREIEANPVYDCDILVARGKLPVDGTDGTVTFLFDAGRKELKPKLRADGTVDYRELGIVENVMTGQVLCKITPPTEGFPGMSVTGKRLLQKRGRRARIVAGKNTELSTDGTAILSKIDGEAELTGARISVNETFRIKENVDHSIGNVKVVGSLQVEGMVAPGFSVEAANNIHIRGVVDNARLSAGGSVKLQSGIIGSELHCGGDLNCRFIENCNIFVKGEIRAEYIVNSRIVCGKSVKVSGMIAKIIGGSCLAGQNIEAKTIGSGANVKTLLELGTDQSIVERQQELQKQTSELEERLNSVKPLLALLSQMEESNRLTPDKREIYDKLCHSSSADAESLAECRKELKEMEESIAARGFGRILCTGTIYPGTRVSIGSAALPVTHSLKNAQLYYSEGDIRVGSAV